MRIRRRRDVERRCVRCGERWTVPGDLAAPPRVSKWQRGVSLPERNAFQGMTTNAAASMQLDLARQRGTHLDAALETVSAMSTCPGCGGVGTFVETPVPRVRRGRWRVRGER